MQSSRLLCLCPFGLLSIPVRVVRSKLWVLMTEMLSVGVVGLTGVVASSGKGMVVTVVATVDVGLAGTVVGESE